MCAGSREEKEIFLDSILIMVVRVWYSTIRVTIFQRTAQDIGFIKLSVLLAATSQKQGMGDSIDAFVTGFKMGNKEQLMKAYAFFLDVSSKDNGRIYDTPSLMYQT